MQNGKNDKNDKNFANTNYSIYKRTVLTYGKE